MKNSKRVVSLILSLLMVLAIFNIMPFTVSAAEIDASATGATSGTTGECTWTLDGTVLTISGNGKMKDYDYWDAPAPWGTDITEVILKDGVTSIGGYAFSGCEELTSITIPDSVTSIGEYVFYGCTGLTSVTIPDSVTSIGWAAFYGCTGLTSITIPVSVADIGEYTFFYCTGLTSVTIPDSVMSIGRDAFKGCTGLTNVTIPDSVTSIEDYAFYGCTGLTSLKLGNSVTSIGDGAFFGCTGLTSVTIPDTVTNIGRQAFGYYYDENWNTAKNEGFTIYGYPGTAAETYASENGFTFIALSAEPKIGDADGDGQVTVRDVTEVQFYLSNMTTQADQETLMFADVDNNGRLDVIDTTWLQRHLTGMEIPYPIGEVKTEAPKVTITETNIKADSVFNNEGYGSLKLNEVYENGGVSSYPQSALIDGKGTYLFPYKDTWNRYYVSDGIVSLVSGAYNQNSFYDKETGQSTNDPIGFYSLDGKELFSGDYYGSTGFKDGYAFVTELHGSGFDDPEIKSYLIDETGQIALNLKNGFTETAYFGEGLYGTRFGTLTKAGSYSEGLLSCASYASQSDYNYGKAQSLFYIDNTGETVLTLSVSDYSDIWSFYEGLAAVRSASTGKYGYIDPSGTLVIPCEYDSCGNFADGLAYVSKNGKYGYINSDNENVIPFEYDSAFGTGSGLATVGKDGKYGLVDYNNNIVVPLEYDDISTYDNGTAYAVKDGTVYIISGYKNG